VTERRGIEAGPDAATVGNHEQRRAFGRQNAPQFAQHGRRAIGNFEAVGDEQPIDRIVGERELAVLDENRQYRSGGRPYERALGLRHQGHDTARFVAKTAEIGRAVADASDGQIFDVSPTPADLAAERSPDDEAQLRFVEVAEVDDVEIHASVALTPRPLASLTSCPI